MQTSRDKTPSRDHIITYRYLGAKKQRVEKFGCFGYTPAKRSSAELA